jgi:hypothetical protein
VFGKINILSELFKERKRLRSGEDELLLEAKRILISDKFSEKNILDNLKLYNKNFELLNEENIDQSALYTENEIKSICLHYGLYFADSQLYKGEFPYEAILKIKDFNKAQGKDLRHFKLVASAPMFKNPKINTSCLLFCETIYGHYFLIHKWGTPLPWYQKLKSFSLTKIIHTLQRKKLQSFMI